MFVKSTGKFLEDFNFQLKLWGFVKIFQPHFELNFFKISIFSLFLTHNLIGVSCGHDIFTDGKTDMGKINLSNTFNMFVKFTENFLEAFEKKIQLKK